MKICFRIGTLCIVAGIVLRLYRLANLIDAYLFDILSFAVLLAGVGLLFFHRGKVNPPKGGTLMLVTLACVLAGAVMDFLIVCNVRWGLLGLFLLCYIAVPILLIVTSIRIYPPKKSKQEPVLEEQDKDLETEIAPLQKKLQLLKLLRGILIAALILSMGFIMNNNNFLPFLLTMVLFIITCHIHSNHADRLKTYLSDNLVRPALEAVFEVTEYIPNAYTDPNRIKGKYFGIGKFDDASGSDYFKGTYKGLAVEMCDIHLTEERTRLSNGDIEKYDATVFRGLWLICDFGKELSAEVRLWEKYNKDELPRGDWLLTENDTFNRHFYIESEDEVEAFYVLTPHMMEYILAMDEAAEGHTHIRFEKDGWVQIAISTSRDGFEVTDYKQNATMLRQQFVKDIRRVTDLIDELRLVDTLYRKPQTTETGEQL